MLAAREFRNCRDEDEGPLRSDAVRYKNNIGPQVRRRRYSLGWSQSDFATKLQLAGLDISRSGVSKIEARLSYVDDKTLLYLAEVLRVPVQDLFPARTPGNRIHDFMEKLETTRF
jgi:transcriptional regulator with XRE-family HTH domain